MVSTSRWHLKQFSEDIPSSEGCTSSASCSGNGASLENDLARGTGSGFGRIGVRSTVAPV